MTKNHGSIGGGPGGVVKPRARVATPDCAAGYAFGQSSGAETPAANHGIRAAAGHRPGGRASPLLSAASSAWWAGPPGSLIRPSAGLAAGLGGSPALEWRRQLPCRCCAAGGGAASGRVAGGVYGWPRASPGPRAVVVALPLP